MTAFNEYFKNIKILPKKPAQPFTLKHSHNWGYKYAENIESFIIGWTFSRNFSMVIIPHHSLNL